MREQFFKITDARYDSVMGNRERKQKDKHTEKNPKLNNHIFGFGKSLGLCKRWFLTNNWMNDKRG